jgi:bile acid:Na+ symporter, BASS family
VVGGLFGQLLLLPPLALLVAWVFRLPPEMATGLFILAVSPGGVTSNAITFVARANVALAVVLTTLSSLITVFTIPILVSWALGHFFIAGEAPTLSIPNTMLQLARVTLLPVAVGMAIRLANRGFADRLTIWLRPASLVVLIAVIGFSLFVSAELVAQNLWRAGPAAYVLNVLSMAVGLAIAFVLRLDRTDALTLGIEVGIHNATLATFLSLTILKDLALAITPTIYGCIMVLNALLLVRLLRRPKAEATA